MTATPKARSTSGRYLLNPDALPSGDGGLDLFLFVHHVLTHYKRLPNPVHDRLRSSLHIASITLEPTSVRTDLPEIHVRELHQGVSHAVL